MPPAAPPLAPPSIAPVRPVDPAAAAAPPPPPAAPAPAGPARTAGSQSVPTQDPGQKARRLARALISDLAVYYPDRRKEGLASGNLKELFEEEIRKSWEEYTEQVGKELADSTTYFTDALNEILAGGRKMF
jgi:hypothetical protein